jgi:hypothetical protein
MRGRRGRGRVDGRCFDVWREVEKSVRSYRSMHGGYTKFGFSVAVCSSGSVDVRASLGALAWRRNSKHSESQKPGMIPHIHLILLVLVYFAIPY